MCVCVSIIYIYLVIYKVKFIRWEFQPCLEMGVYRYKDRIDGTDRTDTEEGEEEGEREGQQLILQSLGWEVGGNRKIEGIYTFLN